MFVIGFSLAFGSSFSSFSSRPDSREKLANFYHDKRNETELFMLLSRYTRKSAEFAYFEQTLIFRMRKHI